jgi:hypothetical protein
MADCLVQVFHALKGFRYRAADHDPKSEIDFQRDMHRALPCCRLREPKRFHFVIIVLLIP